MISGAPERRVATINGEPFVVGESRRVPVNGAKIDVKCLAIRDSSAVVQIVGEKTPRSLVLGSHPVERASLPVAGGRPNAAPMGSAKQATVENNDWHATAGYRFGRVAGFVIIVLAALFLIKPTLFSRLRG